MKKGGKVQADICLATFYPPILFDHLFSLLLIIFHKVGGKITLFIQLGRASKQSHTETRQDKPSGSAVSSLTKTYSGISHSEESWPWLPLLVCLKVRGGAHRLAMDIRLSHAQLTEQYRTSDTLAGPCVLGRYIHKPTNCIQRAKENHNSTGSNSVSLTDLSK